ncbi:MAG: SDR family oxidoreductase [Gemmatimonadaceae bacterium]|nr:SDR family oxidoreductase [Gemmatimonadaceae bacterium]
MKLDGRIAIVTGGGHRVGRVLAVALGRERMTVAVHYNSAASGAIETVRLIEAEGGKGATFKCDLSTHDGPAELIRAVVSSLGIPHVVINSAAVMTRQAFGQISMEDWDRTMNLNLRAPFFVSQAAAAAMADGGAIVNISDLAAFENWPGYVPHSISKAGVVKMTRALARVLAPAIRVNAIAPGAVLLPDEWDESAGKRLADTTPLQRLGNPQDVVNAMLYLLRSDFVTGETLIVDGGRHIRK